MERVHSVMPLSFSYQNILMFPTFSFVSKGILCNVSEKKTYLMRLLESLEYDK